MNQVSTHKKNSTKSLKPFLSINDLRELDYSNDTLTNNEKIAIKNYDKFRIEELNKQVSEQKFYARYMQLQVMANLSPYEEFLKEEYFL